MAKHREQCTHRFVIDATAEEPVSRSQMRHYIWDALGSMGGQLNPTDPFFRSVEVKFRRIPVPSLPRGIK